MVMEPIACKVGFVHQCKPSSNNLYNIKPLVRDYKFFMLKKETPLSDGTNCLSTVMWIIFCAF
jgi:hypothetical protein